MKTLKENLTIMFDYSLSHWATFFSAAFLLNISPGPDLAFILGISASTG
jgi:threonine/homoserine/homoserine lactone efflux protein